MSPLPPCMRSHEDVVTHHTSRHIPLCTASGMRGAAGGRSVSERAIPAPPPPPHSRRTPAFSITRPHHVPPAPARGGVGHCGPHLPAVAHAGRSIRDRVFSAAGRWVRNVPRRSRCARTRFWGPRRARGASTGAHATPAHRHTPPPPGIGLTI